MPTGAKCHTRCILDVALGLVEPSTELIYCYRLVRSWAKHSACQDEGRAGGNENFAKAEGDCSANRSRSVSFQTDNNIFEFDIISCIKTIADELHGSVSFRPLSWNQSNLRTARIIYFVLARVTSAEQVFKVRNSWEILCQLTIVPNWTLCSRLFGLEKRRKFCG